MLFSDHPRQHYARSALREVICQLRFPTILSIAANEPAAFQEAIRHAFPRYARKMDNPPPKTAVVNGVPQLVPSPPVVNYHFLSADSRWKLNLTSEFISLSTLSYDGWESFGGTLDLPLAQFIRLYQPAFFQRIGLRYVNLFSRRDLGLEGTPWRELFTPPYLGPLAEEDVPEERLVQSGVNFSLRLDSSCQAKVHAGPGLVKSTQPGAVQDNEVKFVLDIDLSMGGELSPMLAAGALETLHGHAAPLFEGAVTDVLREALELG